MRFSTGLVDFWSGDEDEGEGSNAPLGLGVLEAGDSRASADWSSCWPVESYTTARPAAPSEFCKPGEV